MRIGYHGNDERATPKEDFVKTLDNFVKYLHNRLSFTIFWIDHKIVFSKYCLYH